MKSPENPVPSISLRFNYRGSYVDPNKHHFGGGDWLDEATCKRALATRLRDPHIRTDSLHVFVQHRKSRWLPFAHGSVAEIFPGLIQDLARDQAYHAVLNDPSLPVLARYEAKLALGRKSVTEALDHAQSLVAVLEKLQAVERQYPSTPVNA